MNINAQVVPPGYIKPYDDYDVYLHEGPPEIQEHLDPFKCGPYEGVIINIVSDREVSEISICRNDKTVYKEAEVYGSLDYYHKPMTRVGWLRNLKEGYLIRANGKDDLLIKFPGAGNFIIYTPPALWPAPVPLKFYLDITPEHMEREKARLMRDFPNDNPFVI